MLSMKDALKEADILQGASPASMAVLASCARLCKKKKGEHLFWDKDEVLDIYIVIDGMVSLYKLNRGGEKKVIFVYGKGKMLNEVILQELPSSINCEILETSYLLCFPKKQFWSVMEQDPWLTKAVLDSMALKIRRLYRQLKNTTNAMRGDKKLAAKLWKLAHDRGVKENCETRIDMKLRITYLAEMLGSKRETVSKQVKILSEQGLVKLENGYFVIPDTEKLRAYFKET